MCRLVMYKRRKDATLKYFTQTVEVGERPSQNVNIMTKNHDLLSIPIIYKVL